MRHPAALARPLIACACALAAGHAAAQSNPFYFRASETLTYDSNVFRVPESQGRSRDGISSTNLTAGIDQPYGRQRWLASAGLTANVYKNQDLLNNTGYDLLLGLDWSALSRWSGDVRIESTQQLADFENYGAQFNVDRRKNLERDNTVNLRAQYGLAALWVLEGSLAHRDVNFSDNAFDDREYRQDQVGFGAAYQPSDLLRLGLAARYTDGRYPQGTGTGPDKFKRDDIDLTANWKASGLSTIDARISATHENHTPLDQRDFRGVTGSIGWNYRPTGKTTIDVRLARDTGTRGNGVPVQIDPTVTASYLTDARLSNRIDAAVRWDATAKITVRARAAYSRDRFDDRFTTNVAGQGGIARVNGDSGNTRNYLVGVSYQATRAWSFGCEAGHRARSTPVFIGTTAYNYDADIASCNAQLMLQ
jgi:hypothetical protein